MHPHKGAQSTTKQDESAAESTPKVAEFTSDPAILRMNLPSHVPVGELVV